MWNELLPLCVSLAFLLLIGCSKEGNDAEMTPQIELVQSQPAELMEEEEEIEETEFPVVQEVYVYDAANRRDPFVPLLVPEGERRPGEEMKVSVENLSLVGVLWDDASKIAILMDQAGNGYVFKEGDSLPGGKVVSVTETSIVFELSQFGIVTKYEISMEEE